MVGIHWFLCKSCLEKQLTAVHKVLRKTVLKGSNFFRKNRKRLPKSIFYPEKLTKKMFCKKEKITKQQVGYRSSSSIIAVFTLQRTFETEIKIMSSIKLGFHGFHVNPKTGRDIILHAAMKINKRDLFVCLFQLQSISLAHSVNAVIIKIKLLGPPQHAIWLPILP